MDDASETAFSAGKLGRTLPPSKAQIRRWQILESAARLFGKRGFHSVGLNDIGREAGVSGPAIYRYFGKKEDLLVEIIDSAMRALVESAEQTRREADGEKALRRLVEHYVTLVVGEPSLVLVWLAERRHMQEEDRARMGRMQRLYIRAWIDSIQEVRADLPEAQAHVLAHSMIGLANSVAFYRSPLEPEKLAGFVENIIYGAVSHTRVIEKLSGGGIA